MLSGELSALSGGLSRNLSGKVLGRVLGNQILKISYISIAIRIRQYLAFSGAVSGHDSDSEQAMGNIIIPF